MGDTFDETWLDRHYGGAPDECSACFIEGKIVKYVNGKCPECEPEPIRKD